MKHLFIINPAAGSRDRTLECSREIVQLCRDLDYRVEISKGPGDCRRLANAAARSGEEYRIYACGGDGTLNEVAAGAAGYGNAAVTVWVGGSGNDLPLQNVLLVKGGESNADKTQVGRISAAGDGHLRRRGLPLSFVQTEQPRGRRGRLSGSLSTAAAGRHRFPRHRAPESMAAARNAQPVRRSSPVGVV